MPAYNAERTIAGAINSILTQTIEDLELVIVDDGSTDRTAEIVRQFDDKRLVFLQTPHVGVAEARNIGNRAAKSKYCAVQDADDYSLPNRLERCLSEIGDADVLIHGAYLNCFSERHQCIERHYLKPQEADEDKILESQYLLAWPVYRKSLWQSKPFRRETTYAYDWMMWIDWVLSGAKVKTLDEGLYEYVRYLGSASHRFELSGEREKAFQKIKNIVKKEYGR